jgi:hypothetical protein
MPEENMPMADAISNPILNSGNGAPPAPAPAADQSAQANGSHDLIGDAKHDAEKELAHEEQLQVIYVSKREVENLYQKRLAQRSLYLGLGLPYLIVAMVFLAGYESRVYRFIFQSSDFHINSPGKRILTLWLIAIVIAVTAFYFSIQSQVNRTRARLREVTEELELKRLATIRGRLAFYREKLTKLSAKTAKVFFFDTCRYDEAEELRNKAGIAMDKLTDTVTASDLSEVESNLTALEEIINREEREQKEQRSWQYAALAIMCLYIIGLGVSVAVFKAADSITVTPVFGVPVAVVLWGAAGSLATILYRFYNEQGRIRFAYEFRWLIARPIIGIIMGAVVYLAIRSGLILLGADISAPAPNGAGQGARIEVYSVIAFLAGFSDKFYLGVIDLLVAQTVRTEEVKPNTIITERQRIPEALHQDESAQSQ